MNLSNPEGLVYDRTEGLPSSGRVLVALSGGVDSSVAAWLLKERGMEVAGVTFRMFPEQHGEKSAGCKPSLPPPVERVKRVGEILGIPVHVQDLKEAFDHMVIGPFCDAYASGRTPNPCVICNATVKWQGLLDLASEMDCGYVATGHYARIGEMQGRFTLLRGLYQEKDQSYALYRLSQEALKRTILPLGSEKKLEVRQTAKKALLPTWDVEESQDVCFIPQGGVKEFLGQRLQVQPGPVLDLEGTRVGTHSGLPFYTVGQRKGLGIPFGRPMYVIEKDPQGNSLVVGPREALQKTTFSVERVNWVSVEQPTPGSRLKVDVQVRYRCTPIPAEVHVLGSRIVHIGVEAHHQAVAPGQSAVWYQGDVLLGGGIIQE